MNNKEATKEQSEFADRQFHIAIAQATRNSAIVRIVESTWDLRYKSRLCMTMLDRAREVRRVPLNDEHQAIVESLRTRDPKAARAAMQAHLGGLIENLMVTAELEAMEQTRARLAAKREEIARRAASTTRKNRGRPLSELHIHAAAPVAECVARESPTGPAPPPRSPPAAAESGGTIGETYGVVLVERIVDEKRHLVVVVVVVDTQGEVGDAIGALYGARVLAQREVDRGLVASAKPANAPNGRPGKG